MTKLLVTGSSGFVGSELVKRLTGSADYEINALVRRDPLDPLSSVVYHRLHEFNDIDAEHEAYANVEVLIHLASRVHVMEDTEEDPLAAFRAVNVEQTLKLARCAAAAGVRRFIFISSVKVNGEGSASGTPYRETDVPAPSDYYGVSKMEAEEGLRVIAAETGLEVVIIRPVLVYGPGVKANFANMMKWLHRGVPLPFGAIKNLRSLVSLDNVVDLIVTCISHPAAADQTFLVSDGEDLSTTELLKKLGHALGRPARLLNVPEWLLANGAKLVGKGKLSQRLCGSLQVDTTKARSVLGWSPVTSIDQGLQKTAEHFLNEQSR